MSRPWIARVIVVALAAPLAGGCGGEGRDVGTWQAVEIDTQASFEDICFSDALHGWMVGGGSDIAGGIIGRTRDGGRTWKYTRGLVPTGPDAGSFHVNAVHFADPLNGLAVSDGGRIFKTADGGLEWRQVREGRGPTDHLFGLEMRDRRVGWAVGLAGVLSTTDGGEHWVELTRPGSDAEPTWARAIAFPDKRHGFKVGQLGELETTSDAGKHWVRQALPLESDEKPYLFDIDFPDRKHGWIVGENGTIFRTTDAGSTWKRQDTGLPDAEQRPSPAGSAPGPPGMGQVEGPLAGLFLTRVRFRDRLHGWTVGFWSDQARSVVLGTRDGGATWAVETEARGEVLRALTIGADGRAWAVGDRAGEGAQTLLVRSSSR